MPRKSKYIDCSVMQLPNKELIPAAKFAAACNPANQPPLAALAKLDLEATPEYIAVLTSKYFGPGGVKLTVAFREQTSAALADKILSHMNAWSKYANIEFSMYGGAWTGADVRIGRGAGGYYSYLGTDVLRIPRNQITMNLQGFTLNTSDDEYRRVIRHETGHTIGCPHEHMRRAIIAKLNRQRTIQYFMRTQGWSEMEVMQQVLTPIEEIALMGTPQAEVDSIMCYGLPAQITNDNIAIPGGSDITQNDGMFIGTVYPLPTAPPPVSLDEFVITKPGTYRLVPQ